MTFDDIIASGDLLDGVWDTQRFTPRNGRRRVGSDEEKTERSLADRGLLFPVASDETACDEDQRPCKR